MGKWLERLKQKNTQMPSGAGSKGSKVDKKRAKNLEVRQSDKLESPEKNENVSRIKGSKGPKGGFEPFEPLPSRPFANYSRGTPPATDAPTSFVDLRQRTSPAEWALLERWLQKLNPSDLPSGPFALDTSRTVVDKEQYLDALKRELKTGPSGPRARLGAFQAECRKLRAILDAVSENTSFSPRDCPSASTREGYLVYRAETRRFGIE